MACYEGHCVTTCDDISVLVDVDRRVVFIRVHETFICHNDGSKVLLKNAALARTHTHPYIYIYMYVCPRKRDATFLKIVI